MSTIEAIDVEHVATRLIGASAPMLELRSELERIAQSDAKVLIMGESGVGKELVANQIHALSPRALNRFVAVNCAGLPETLLESELFGHVKGSFTGAYRDKLGKLELASEGTIFLDEVGEMTLRMQGLLLRFLETGELQKVGADGGASHVDVRVLAATNCDLTAMVARGKFRADLYYRLKVIHIVVPPLRDRRADIAELIRHFLDRFTVRHRGPVRDLDADTVAALVRYDWPGNVRELENVIERLVVTGRRSVIQLADLPPEISTAAAADTSRHRPERHRTAVDDLYERMVRDRQTFWAVVYPLYMQREITRTNVRDLVRRALADSRGSYKLVARMFNVEMGDYKRFLNFLRKHECQVPFRVYRDTVPAVEMAPPA